MSGSVVRGRERSPEAGAAGGDGLKVRLRRVGAGVVVLALLGMAGVVGCNGAQQAAKPSGSGGAPQTAQKPSAQHSEKIKALFRDDCGSCHVLSEAGATGSVGPNLDALKPDVQTLLLAIREGREGMPAKFATGKEARRIAEFVSHATGAQ